MKKVFYGNLVENTQKNKFYRKVAYTSDNLQLVYMKIKPKDEIGMEVHNDVTQMITIVSGKGLAIVGQTKYELNQGTTIIIPQGKKHNILNVSKRSYLSLYSFYTPPEHKPNAKQMYKKD